jgi:hypothetical protein
MLYILLMIMSFFPGELELLIQAFSEVDIRWQWPNASVVENVVGKSVQKLVLWGKLPVSRADPWLYLHQGLPCVCVPSRLLQGSRGGVSVGLPTEQQVS